MTYWIWKVREIYFFSGVVPKDCMNALISSLYKFKWEGGRLGCMWMILDERTS